MATMTATRRDARERLAHRHLDSPFGALLLVSGDAGLTRIALATEDHDRVLDELARTRDARLDGPANVLDRPARQLDEYFAGARRTFDVELDLRSRAGFRRGVLDALRAVPYGGTTTYAALAAAAGRPAAARAAGNACATNPLSIIVPCHRALRADGIVRHYLGGTAMKRALLDLEAGGAAA